MVPYGMKIELHGYDFLRESRIQGSSMGSKLDHLISSHIKFDEINEGYAKLKGGDVLRELTDFGVAKKMTRLRLDTHGARCADAQAILGAPQPKSGILAVGSSCLAWP
jgi:hypothetical protein